MSIAWSTVIGIAAWLAAATTTFAFQMDVPCLPIERSAFVAAMLADGTFRQEGYGRFVAADGFIVDTTGMRDYCSETLSDRDPLLIVQAQGPGAYYSISIARFRSPADADRYLGRLQKYLAGDDHLMRSSRTEVVQIMRVPTR